MIDEAMEFLVGSKSVDSIGKVAVDSKEAELLVVDDGSSDRTSLKALELAQAWQSRSQGKVEIRVITLAKNRGKGGAVQHVSLPCKPS